MFIFQVLSSLNEPLVGWVDNWNGPTGVVSAVGKGLFRTIMCDKNVVADLIPVDIVINLMVTAAWKTGMSKQSGLTIYNCCTGEQRPITWGNFVNLAIESMRKHPLGEFHYKLFNKNTNIFYQYLIFFNFNRGSPLVSNWSFTTKSLHEYHPCNFGSLHSSLHFRYYCKDGRTKTYVS